MTRPDVSVVCSPEGTVGPDDGDGQAPMEGGTPLLETARTIDPIVIGNRFGGGGELDPLAVGPVS